MISQFVFLLVGIIVGYIGGAIIDIQIHKIGKRERKPFWEITQEEIDKDLHIDKF